MGKLDPHDPPGTETDWPQNEIRIAHQADVSSARIAGGQLADQTGVNKTQKHCFVTSISELASNALFHAGKGSVALGVVSGLDGPKGLEVVAWDQGKGIEDVNLAIQDGYSTNGGLGGGLSGVSRLMSEMQISSALGAGTVVRAVKWVHGPNIAKQPPPSSRQQSPKREPSASTRPPMHRGDAPEKNRRRCKRFDVAWPGRCGSDRTLVTGPIRNVSETGAFLQHHISGKDEGLIRMGKAPPAFVVGSFWRLSLGPGHEPEPLVVRATIRWVGYQFELACDGIGFEFESRLGDIACLVHR